jgi:hypothetical protein
MLAAVRVLRVACLVGVVVLAAVGIVWWLDPVPEPAGVPEPIA